MINIAYIFPLWTIILFIFIKGKNSISRKIYVLLSLLPVFYALVTKKIIYDSDMFRYIMVFNEILKDNSLTDTSFNFDFGFLILYRIISLITTNNIGFVAIFSAIYLYLLARIIYKRSFFISYTTIIYICLGFCYYPSNILRSSLAVMFFANTSVLFIQNMIISIFFILVSSFIHASAGIFIISFIVYGHIKKIILLLIPISTIIFLHYSHYIGGKFFHPASMGSTFFLGIIYIILSLYCFFNLRKIKTDMLYAKIYTLFTFLSGVALLLSFKFFIFTRLYILFSVFIPLFFDMFAMNLKNNLRIFFISGSLFLYIIYYIFMVYYGNFSL